MTLDGSCWATAKHRELTVCMAGWSPRFTRDCSDWGFDPDLVPHSAGGDRNISFVAIIDPSK